jgi:hypothetical protein
VLGCVLVYRSLAHEVTVQFAEIVP